MDGLGSVIDMVFTPGTYLPGACSLTLKTTKTR